jgi:hypothetical protein
MTLFVIYSYDIGERYNGSREISHYVSGKNIMKEELGNGG